MYESVHLFVACLMLWSSPLRTADAVSALEAESARVDSYAVVHPGAVEGRIRRSFSAFAGSPANASALVRGLRDGTAVELIATAPDGSLTAAGFTPATGPMSYGNVRISLALAQDQLAALGVTDPTAAQLAAALNGGEIAIRSPSGPTTTLKGVLELRAAGQSWGDIAKRSGARLGPVISGLKTTYGGSVAAVTIAPANSDVGFFDKAQGGSKGTNTVTTLAATKTTDARARPAHGKAAVTANGITASGAASSNPRMPRTSGNSTSARAVLPITTAVAFGGTPAAGVSDPQDAGSNIRN